MSSHDRGRICAEEAISFSAERTAALQAFLKRSKLTLNTLLHGVWALFLSGLSGEEDVLFGTTVSGRPPELSGVETAIGPYINTLPIRVRIARDEELPAWLNELQVLEAEMFNYQYSPLVQDWSEVPLGIPLFESILIFENYPLDVPSDTISGPATARKSKYSVKTKYPITLVSGPGRELEICLVYDQRRFDSRGIENVLNYLRCLIDDIIFDANRRLTDLISAANNRYRSEIMAQETHTLPEAENWEPRASIEGIIVGLVARILGTERINTKSSFFELGGHSLLAARLVSQIRDKLDIEISLKSLFETPTVARLAELVEEARSRGQFVQAPPIISVPRGGHLPLSFEQQRLWFIDQLERGNVAYNVTRAARMRGGLDITALKRSLNEIVRRHETLRTIFPEMGGRPVQVILPAEALPLDIIDLTELTEDQRETESRRLLAAEAQRPFDLSRGPLLRITLERLTATDHLLILMTHHIISDAWSLGLFIGELQVLYEAFLRGKEASLADLPVQYADYAVWQREMLQGERAEAQLDFWKRRLSRMKTLELPLDYQRPPIRSSRGERLSFMMPAGLSASLRQLSLQEGATLFVTMLAAFKALLYRYTGQDDITVGTATAGRNRAETENLIGLFVNTLVMRTDLSGNPTFRELLKRVRDTALEAYTYQDIPFDRIVEEVQPERSLDKTPLIQTAFGLMHPQRQTAGLSGLTVRPVNFEDEAVRLDLTLWIFAETDSLRASWSYRSDLFDPATIRLMEKRYERLLQDVVADPGIRIDYLQMPADSEGIGQNLEEKSHEESQYHKFISVKPKQIRVNF